MFLDDPNIFTLSRGIMSLNSLEIPQQHLMAGAVIATYLLWLFFFIWKNFWYLAFVAELKDNVKGEITKAIEIINRNDRGGFTIPTNKLYPPNGIGIPLLLPWVFPLITKQEHGKN